MNLILNIFVYLISSTLGLLILKTSLKINAGSSYLALFSNKKFLLGFFLYAISFISWILLLSKRDLSVIYPLVIGLSYITVLATSFIFLHENISYIKITAAFFIGCGIILLALNK